MAKHRFYKYQGAGNDFVLLDNRKGLFDPSDTPLVKKLCDRRFGIGADGLMLLQDTEDYDFEMLYYNADGAAGTMCGNGGRCIVSFAKQLGIVDRDAVFLAVDGVHHASVSDGGGWVSLQMIDVMEVSSDGDAYLLDTGSPHYVLLVDGLEHYPVYAKGREIRNREEYRAKGINVNFVAPLEDGFFVRTYERGVEDETFACGTGATAAAMAMAVRDDMEGRIELPIKVLGGDLRIRFHKEALHFTNVYLEGPATFVFEGVVDC